MPGGSASVAKANWAVLAGRDVTLWPDADEPGRKAMEEVAHALAGLGATTIRRVRLPPHLPKGWDLADSVPEDIDCQVLLDSATLVDPSLVNLMVTARELRNLDIPQREYIVKPFIAMDSLSMVFAARGLGKTWFALTLALAVAHGQKFLSYDISKPHRVLFIDGEMTLSDLKGRLVRLNGPETEDLILLPSERLFREAVPLNINSEEHQTLIVQALERLELQRRRPSLIILDNLSSLGGGVDENDNSALDMQLRWLVSLRHKGYAVMLIHHAGKSGDQRGASRREDLLDTSIKLEPVDKSEAHRYSGAVFDVEFVKTRGPMPKPSRMRVELIQTANGSLNWGLSQAGKIPPNMATLMSILKGKWEGPRENPSRVSYHNQAELVEAMGVTKGTVSKHLKTLREVGLVYEHPNRGLLVTVEGFEALKVHYDEVPSYAKSVTLFKGEQEKLPL